MPAPPAPPDVRPALLAVLRDIAPEAEVDKLAGDRPLREQIDLDSLDWVNLLDALGERFGVALPASRLGPATTLDALATAVAARLAAPPSRCRRAAPSADRTRRLANGRRVRLRPINAADAELEAAFVRDLSMTSRYKRFMSSLRELSPAKLKYFTDVDQVSHIALAALPADRRGPERWVGVARCVTDPQGGACEFAVTVADDWQGSGLAGVLMRALMRAARERGLKTMYGNVLASNRRMLALARQLGFKVGRAPDEPGTVRVERAL